MFAERKSTAEDISIKDVNCGQLKNAMVGIDAKYKNCKKKIRFENDTPCLDINIKITNSSIKEIQNESLVQNVSSEEFEFIKTKMQEEISKKVVSAFEKSKEFKADIFGAFDIANKFHYTQIKGKFESMEDFLSKLKLNVNVKVLRLEF